MSDHCVPTRCNHNYEEEITRLTALLAERESTILRLQKDGHELLDAYEKKHKLFVDTNKILAERDAEIKGLEEHLQLLREHHNKQLSASQQECERLSSVLGLREYTNHIRKQAAMEIIQYIIDQGLIQVGCTKRQVYEIDRGDITELKQCYGLEG